MLLLDETKREINSETKASDNTIDNLKKVIDEAAEEMEREHHVPTEQPGPREPPKDNSMFEGRVHPHQITLIRLSRRKIHH